LKGGEGGGKGEVRGAFPFWKGAWKGVGGGGE